MKISEILKLNNRTLSFEVFPPKNETSFEQIKRATEEIASIRPHFMSVTYGAGGGTSRFTLDIADNTQRKHGVPTLAHLSCISSTRATVRERIEDMRRLGIENVMALRGDIPPEMKGIDPSLLDYRYASELVCELRCSGHDFCIGGACYPEVHPESRSAEEDIEFLKIKVDRGCDFLTTQMFFDNSLFYSFVERAERSGIHIPVIAGIMPITRYTQLQRAIELSGSYIPSDLLSGAERFKDDPTSMESFGIDFATKQIRSLYEAGVKSIHVYTMNKPSVARAIRDNLLDLV